MRRWWRRRRRIRGDGLEKLDKPLSQRDPYLAAIERAVRDRSGSPGRPGDRRSA